MKDDRGLVYGIDSGCSVYSVSIQTNRKSILASLCVYIYILFSSDENESN
jgi:hypothetical protein